MGSASGGSGTALAETPSLRAGMTPASVTRLVLGFAGADAGEGEGVEGMAPPGAGAAVAGAAGAGAGAGAAVKGGASRSGLSRPRAVASALIFVACPPVRHDLESKE